MLGALRRVAFGATLATRVAPAAAQMTDSTPAPPTSGALRVQAVPVVTRVDPAIAGETYSEGYLAQPVIMAHGSVFRGALSGVLTLNFEGLTMDRGQLTPGAYGEGYADRRHPHTYLHEAIIVARGAFRGTGVSVSVGKGFVPFGTDDPMMRPFVAYPVNHHLAQILERYVAIGAIQRGRLVVEGGLFNGDEPRSAGEPPDVERFGDSWAARATVAATRDLELQGSYAFVTSPELAEGAGLDQRKWSAAARFERSQGLVRWALLEWAHTDALLGDLRTNSFSSVLGEASFAVGPFTMSGRYENTTRPEEERLLDPFRTSRNPTDLGIIGVTRWQTGTVAFGTSHTLGAVDLAPFVEVAYAQPSEVLTPTAFIPRQFYGADSLWSVSLGARVGIGPMIHRMGRYGAAMPSAPRGQRHAAH